MSFPSLVTSHSHSSKPRLYISDEWINHIRYIHSVECYYDVKMLDVKKKGRWGLEEWGDWVMGIKKEKRKKDVKMWKVTAQGV